LWTQQHVKPKGTFAHHPNLDEVDDNQVTEARRIAANIAKLPELVRAPGAGTKLTSSRLVTSGLGRLLARGNYASPFNLTPGGHCGDLVQRA
jgi:hypothetical protein